MSAARTIATIFVDPAPGEHIRKTMQRAIDAKCDFFCHNDRLYSVTGEFANDAPEVALHYLRGRLDVYQCRREDRIAYDARRAEEAKR